MFTLFCGKYIQGNVNQILPKSVNKKILDYFFLGHGVYIGSRQETKIDSIFSGGGRYYILIK